MTQQIIFCASYGEIRRTLYLAERYGRESPVAIVIPGINDLYLFFREIVRKKALPVMVGLIYFESYRSQRMRKAGIARLVYTICDIIRERRWLREIYRTYFTEMRGCDVYFHNRGFSGTLFYLVLKLGRKNRVVNTSPTPPGLEPPRKYTPGSIAELASLVILKLIYGFDIALGVLPNTRGFIFMTDAFIGKTVDRVIGWEEIEEMMKDFDYTRFRVFDTGKYRVIYFDNSLVEAGYVADREMYRKEMRAIFTVLTRHFPESEIARKYHPSYPDDKTLIDCGDVLPDFIPAELLYDENLVLYLGFFSYSISNIEKGKVLSLMDLVTFKDSAVRDLLKNNLLQVSRAKVVFPASLEELEREIAALKEQ